MKNEKRVAVTTRKYCTNFSFATFCYAKMATTKSYVKKGQNIKKENKTTAVNAGLTTSRDTSYMATTLPFMYLNNNNLVNNKKGAPMSL